MSDLLPLSQIRSTSLNQALTAISRTGADLIFCSIQSNNVIFGGKLEAETNSYSYRRATIGSTGVARRAGVQIAALATAISTLQAPARVHGSAAPIPYK